MKMNKQRDYRTCRFRFSRPLKSRKIPEEFSPTRAPPMSRCSNDACASPLGDGGKKTCGACRAVKYCGKACQKAHWKVHKPRCADLANYRLRVQLDGKVNPDGTRSTRQEVGEAQISRRVNFVPPPPPTDPRNDFSDVDVDDPQPTYVPEKYNALPDNDCAKAFELIVAVQHKRPDVIRDLCYVKKYNPNWVTKDGMSPMVIACGRGEVDVIQALLECGSRPDLVCPMDAQGETIPAFLGLVLGYVCRLSQIPPPCVPTQD